MRIKIVILIIGLFWFGSSYSQNVDSLLNSITKPATEYSSAAFKATRIINGHSIEQMKKYQLDVRIHHRFGQLNTGASNLWGIDQSNVFLGLDYGVTDWLMVGVGHTPYEKTYTGYSKIKLYRQCKGEKNMPLSISLIVGTDIVTTPWDYPDRTNYLSSRLSYVWQVLLARKFTEAISLQIMPTIIHRNMIPEAINSNDMYAVGVGGRIKLSKRVSFNGEYYYNIQPNITGQPLRINPLSFGFDIETGGHVFQLMLTNSQTMFERGFITETTGKWNTGSIHPGFNISRVFTIK